MGGVIGNFDDVVNGARKDLSGAGGKAAKAAFPAELLALPGLLKDGLGDASPIFKTIINVGKQLNELDRTSTKMLQAIDKAGKAVASADFGLDPKKAEDKKAIAAAQKKIMTALAKVRDEVEDKRKIASDLNKTVASAGKSATSA